MLIDFVNNVAVWVDVVAVGCKCDVEMQTHMFASVGKVF